MARQIILGVDIGSFQTKAVIAEGVYEQDRFTPRIIGTGSAESRGVERGYVVDSSEAAESVRLAVGRAEKMAGVKVKRAFVSFGGIGLGSLTSEGSITISRADMEITERELSSALEAAEAAIPKSAILNKRIINSVPLEYKIDGKPVWGEALGLKANKLEVKALFLTCLEHHLAELIKTFELAQLEVVDVVASPVAASFVTVSKKERRVGCLLADIGGETLSLVAFENNNLVSLEVLPIGGADITNDLALGLKLSLEDAENVKLGGLARATFSKKKFEEIVFARLGDCFELIETHLKKIGRERLLPAGIIMTGGTSSTNGIKQYAEEFLSLPSHVAEIHFGATDKGRVRENIWATACGLALTGFNSSDRGSFLGPSKNPLNFGSGKNLFSKISKLISQVLP